MVAGYITPLPLDLEKDPSTVTKKSPQNKPQQLTLIPTSKTGQPKPKGIPKWLKDQIEQQDPATFGRYARWTECRCGAAVLEAWDAYDNYAGQYRADPNRITSNEELDAILTGRQTFELRIDDRGKTLSRRDHHRIRKSPATAHKYPVVPEHKCNAPLGRRMKPTELGAPIAQQRSNCVDPPY